MRKILLFLSFFIFCISCVTTPYYSLYKNNEQKIFTLKVDDNTTELQKKQIIRATKAWRKASNEVIHFNIQWNIKKAKDVRMELDRPSKIGIFVWNLKEKERKIVSKEMKEAGDNGRLHGLFLSMKNSTAYILTFPESFTEDHYYQVMMHELGHLMGLEHGKNKQSIMASHTEGWCVTQEDAEQLCDIFNCIPKPECD